MKRIVAAVVGALHLIGSVTTAAAEAAPDCQPSNGITPYCVVHAPEDLELLADGHTLLVSQMRDPFAAPASSLIVFDTRTGKPQELPVRGDMAHWGDGSCNRPDPEPGFHGLAVRMDPTGDVSVLVVNHGTRESVERFTLITRDTQSHLIWEGCVSVPTSVLFNDVVWMGRDGFAATVVGERRHFASAEGMKFLMSGAVTGAVTTWAPASGYASLTGSELPFPNGIAHDPSGDALLVASWSGRKIVRYDLREQRVVAAVPLNFLPDNLSVSSSSILVAGYDTMDSARDCLDKAHHACSGPFSVARVNPVTMQAHRIFHARADAIAGASVAIAVADCLWIGAFSGDRVLRAEPECPTPIIVGSANPKTTCK